MRDLRLAPPAAVAWSLCAVVLLFPGIASGWLSVGCLVLAGVGALCLFRAHGQIARMLAVSAVAGLLSMLSASVYVQAIHAEPLVSLAEAHSNVTVRAVVTGDPRATTSVGGTDRWSLRVRVHSLTSGQSQFTLDVPLAVFGGGVVPAAGAVIEVAGRLAPATWARDVSASLNATTIVEVESPDPLAAAATQVRSGLVRALDGVQPDAAALVAGLAVGDESHAPALLISDMRSSGLSHLTAVSGGNVMIVIALVLLLGRLLALRTRWRVLLASLTLVFFVVLVRPEPSVLRAVVMGAVSLLALTTGSRSRGIPALCAAIIVLVMLAPALALSLGFVLSVAATAGLLLLSPIIRARLDHARGLRRLPEVVRLALAVALAAQVTTAPFIASLGNGLSLVSVPANLLAAPAVPGVTVLGLGAAIASTFSPHLAWLLAHCAAPGAWWISWVAHTSASLPLGVVPWPAGVLGGLLVVVLGGVALLGWHFARSRELHLPTPLLIALGLSVVVVVCVRPPGAWPPTGWVIVACDVGQGDGLIVRTGERSAIVIDTGPEPVAISRCLDDLQIEEIPAVVLSHFHADHVEGLPGVLGNRPVGAVYVSPVREPLNEAEKVDQWCADAGIAEIPISAGDTRVIGELRWTAVWPARVIRDGSVPNNSSVVLLVDTYGLRLLLTGDVEAAAQVAVRSAITEQPIDVVKVPHHGSRMAEETFPKAVSPTVALVSVGRDNDYGHPAPGTMALWEATGATIGRTDLDGDLAVMSDLSLVRRGVLGE